MRRSPANSTNRSLAAFGKLQHIQYRRYQHTAHTISSGSVCRHLKIAGRIACFMISSGYQPPSAIVATQPPILLEHDPKHPNRLRRIGHG